MSADPFLACPTPDEWENALAGGELKRDDSAFAQHLEDCAVCRQRLDELALAGSGDAPFPSVPLTTNADSTARNAAHTSENGASSGRDGSWTLDLRERLCAAVAARIGSVGTAADVARESVPDRLGDFELLERIGAGGMGTVFRARQVSLDRIVALKVIRHNRFNLAEQVRRFRREADAVARLSHLGIVSIFDAGESGAFVFFAMPLLEGGTLADHPTHRSPTDAAELLLRIADAVAYAHSRGVIHRDLKPSNVLLDADGQPCVADFGLAKQIASAEDLTRTGELLGTPAYMSPEQAGNRHEVSIRSDVYGLGAILYFLLTGRPPFVADDAHVIIHQVLSTDPPPPRAVCNSAPIELETIALKSLSKNPADRYETANELAAELRRYLAGEAILARRVSPLGRIRRLAVRHPLLVGLIGLLVLVLLLGTTVSTYFGIVANQRSFRLAETNGRLVVAQQASQQAAQRAEKEAAAAEARAEAAMQLLEGMLYDVQQEFDDPAEHKAKRSLLQTVVDHLSRVPEGLVDPTRVKRSRAAALLGLAEVSMDAGDESGATGLTASRPLFEQAVQLYREIHQADPNSKSAAFELSKVLIEYGDSLAYADEWRGARDLFLEALSLAEQAADSLESTDTGQIQLADAEVLSGEALSHTGERERGRVLLERACRRYRRLVSDDSPPAQRIAYATACRELGDWHIHEKKFAEAETQYRLYLRLAQHLVAEFPLWIEPRMDLSTAHERMGDLWAAQDELAPSRREYELSLEVAQPLALAAPGNDQTLWEVSFSYQKVASASFRMGDLQRAEETAKECAQIRRRIVQSDPTNRHRVKKLLQTLQTLATVYRRRHIMEDAIVTYEEAIRLTEQLPTTERTAVRAELHNRIAQCREEG